VKRLLLSIILALGLHALILSADFSWLKLAPQPTLPSRSIAIVLSPVKRQAPGPEADLFQIKQLASQPSAALDKIAERQPEPIPINKNSQNPAPIKPKQNLKALTLKKQTSKTVETIQAASNAKSSPHPAAEAKIGISSNSDTQAQAPGLAVAPDAAFIKRTSSMAGGSAEPFTTAAAPPATATTGILPESPQIDIARPLYKQNTSPRYPLRARRMGYEGLVMLKVLVDESGRVNELEVLQSSGYAILDKAALSSVKKWMFVPGTEGGKKKKMWVKIPIRFELE
jgi:TonB family protein